MNIAQAVKEYQDACGIKDNPPFYGIVLQLIERAYGEALNNDSYFDALCLTHVMLDRSLSDVCILTGGGAEGFCSTLQRPFLAAAERLKQLGGKIRMIILNHDTPVQFLEDAKVKYDGVFDFILAKAPAGVRHFMVCDDRMLRLEDAHDPICNESLASTIHAQVYFNNPQLAKNQKSLFDGIWERIRGKKGQAK